MVRRRPPPENLRTTLSDLAFGVDTINVERQRRRSIHRPVDFAERCRDWVTTARRAISGTLSLANFADPQGLTPISGNMWLASPISGVAAVAAPLTAGMGSLESGAVEGSNVDLLTQLVNLIGAQQAYQANVQGINIEQQDIQRLLTIQ